MTGETYRVVGEDTAGTTEPPSDIDGGEYEFYRHCEIQLPAGGQSNDESRGYSLCRPE